VIQQFRRRPPNDGNDAPAGPLGAASNAGSAGGPVAEAARVRATQWSGYNIDEVRELLGDAFGGIDLDEPNVVHVLPRGADEPRPVELLDWVLDGPGHPHSCAPEQFTADYEPVDPTS